jgi:hypothetical protein
VEKKEKYPELNSAKKKKVIIKPSLTSFTSPLQSFSVLNDDPYSFNLFLLALFHHLCVVSIIPLQMGCFPLEFFTAVFWPGL